MANHSHLGTQLMDQIASGELKYHQSNIAQEVKGRVTTAMDEIIQLGARIRPLKLNGKRVGWIRPLAYAERKILDQLIEDESERILLTLTHCTSLTEDEVLDLDIHELNSILHRLYNANVADLSLFPYISAYVTTQASQNLWCSRHDLIYDRKIITLPDGKTLRLLATPDHINLWATLSTIRQNSINRLEESLNFGTLIKAQIGKSAEKYVKELIRSLNMFQVDLLEPWTEVVDYVKLQANKPHFEDGFGHAHEDNTIQGLMREMDGMFQGDRHEQLMQTFYDKQLSEAKEKETKIQEIIQQRRKALDEMEDDGALVVVTDAEVRRREREIQSRSQSARLQEHIQELTDQEEEELPIAARMTKYYEK